MKQILLAAIFVTTLSATAQTNISNTSTIPVAVTDAFLKKFPNNTAPTWSPKTYTTPNATTVYIVEFATTMSERKNEAWIDKDGKIVMHRKVIELDEVPEEIRNSVLKNYPEFQTVNAERIEEGGHTNYLLNIQQGARSQKIKVDSKGNVLP